MTVPMRNAPTNRIVCRSWLKHVLPAEVDNDRALPAEVTAFMRSHGFVQIRAVVGGSPDRDVPIREPVFGLRLWVAPTVQLEQPQWNAAERLAGWVIDAAYAHPPQGVVLTPGVLLGAKFAAYRPARVQTALALSEPREINDDPGNWAGFDLDLQLYWTEN